MARTNQDLLIVLTDTIGLHCNNPLITSQLQDFMPLEIRNCAKLNEVISEEENQRRKAEIERDGPAIVSDLMNWEITTIPVFDPRN